MNGPISGWRKPKKLKNQPYSKQPGPIANPIIGMEMHRGKAGTYPLYPKVKAVLVKAAERDKDKS